MRTRLTTRRTRGELWWLVLAALASLAVPWAVGCDEILGIQEALDASLETGAHRDALSKDAPTSPDGGAPADADADAGACPAPHDLSADCEGGLLRCTEHGSCEINPLNDPNNCGECGRKCDGDCSGGTCVPTQIDNSGWAGSRVAWAGDQQAIWIAGEEGGEQALLELLDDGGASAVSGDDLVIADLAVEGDQDYVLENYGLDTFSFDGGQVDSFDPGYTLGPDGRLAYDATRLYYTEGIDDGGVASIVKDGGGYVRLAESQSHPSDILLVDGGVVFLNRATEDASNGAILFVDPAEPGTALTKVSNLGPVGELVSAHDGTAFYGLGDKGEIWRLDTSAFSTHRVATWARVDHIAVDGNYIVFSGKPKSELPSGIYRMRRCGGEALPVMTDSAYLGAPTGLMLYGAYVYWVANGSLYRTTF
jgi:hypothetical protein